MVSGLWLSIFYIEESGILGDYIPNPAMVFDHISSSDKPRSSRLAGLSRVPLEETFAMTDDAALNLGGWGLQSLPKPARLAETCRVAGRQERGA